MILAVALMSIAAVAGVLCRTASPSTRSLLWNSTLLASLVVPLAWAFGPTLTLAVPARFVAATSAPVIQTAAAHGSQPAGTRDESLDSAALDTRRADMNRRGLLILWFSGVAFFAASFGRQILFARRLARRASPARRHGLDALVADAKSLLGIRIDVAVLQSAEIDVPLAMGLVNPTILLPVYASEWADDELRIVLLHELAHVQRADVHARATAMIACAVHWFNPLVWLLSSLATRDAELAADDIVIQAGVRPSTYAETLLNLAGNLFQYPNLAPAMPLARSARLSDRVNAILADSRPRSDVGVIARSAVLVGTCVLALLASCVRLVPSRPESPALGNSTRVATATVALGRAATVNPTTKHRLSARADSTWIDGATRGLIALLDDPSPQVRGAAVRSLGRLRARGARPAVLRLLEDPDKAVQYDALQSLSQLRRDN